MKVQLKAPNIMINKLQVLIGIIALLIGTLVYLFDRPPDQIYFIYSSDINISLYKIFPNLFGLIGNSFPSFVHVFSFILITAALISCHKRGYIIICLSWALVDCSFELGQKFKSLFLKIIPSWFAGIPFLENTKNYFVYGTFDCNDLIATAIGSIIAYFILLITMERSISEP